MQTHPTTLPQPSLDDTQLAFAYKTDAELRRAHLLFRTLQYPTLTKVGPWFVRWALAWRMPIQGLLETYFFDQFCGGKTLAETTDRSAQLYKFGVGSILDYAVEAQKSEAGYNRAVDELLRVIDHARARPEVPFVALKLSALGSLDLLAKRQAGAALGPVETVQYDHMAQRLERVCSHAAAVGQPVMIDAEESWIQDEIDQLAEAQMLRWNTERVLVYTTVQLYRHDRLAYLTDLLARFEAAGKLVGVKLVRGAYLEKENDRAREKGYPTPIQPDKAATDRDYDAAVTFCLAHLDRLALCAGTHNEASALKLAQQLDAQGTPRNHPHVYLSQLLGMSDHISFNLAASGYNCAKYLPYGPLTEVLPYLFRRAEENTSIAGQSPRELALLERELRRRSRQKQLR